ncbi:MAG: riboflavin kinase [Patescibacteria group bacterium]
MTVIGTVIKGAGKGRDLYGVPTANVLLTSNDELVDGVFAAKTTLEQRSWPSVACLRRIEDGVLCEVHLLGFDGDLYEKEIVIELLEQVSPLIQFESSEQMFVKILGDLERVKYVFRHNST